MTRASVTAVTANIGRGVDDAVALRNIARVMRAYRQDQHRAFGAVIGWQEIDDDDRAHEYDLLNGYIDEQARRFRGVLVGGDTTCPVYVAPGWSVVRFRSDTTSPGRAGWTPHRVANQVLIEHDATGMRLVVVNGQYPRDVPQLADLWRRCDDSWRDDVVPRWMGQGVSMLCIRDRNRPARRSPKLAPHEQQLLGDGSSIDQVSFIRNTGPRAARLLRRGPVRTVDLTIDGHNAHGRPLTFLLPN